MEQAGWGETTRTLDPWKQGFLHPTWNEYMGWFARYGKASLVIMEIFGHYRLRS